MSIKDFNNTNIVKFSYLNQEYANFYERHKTICDEITGGKLVIFKNLKSQEEVEIGRGNFIIAIKRLQAFIINYAHNFDDKSKEKEVFNLMYQLEEDFINDYDYNALLKKGDNLSSSNRAALTVMYFNYLFRCFNLIVKVSQYLQTSMMIGTKNIRKLIEWYDTKPFFDRLGEYREEVSNTISNFVLSKVELHYKKVLGYHYTYRILVDYKELQQIEELIRVCNIYIFNEDFLKFVYEIRSKGLQDERVKKENVLLKKVFYNILKLTNISLSEKNVLPKINRRVLFDKTGI